MTIYPQNTRDFLNSTAFGPQRIAKLGLTKTVEKLAEKHRGVWTNSQFDQFPELMRSRLLGKVNEMGCEDTARWLHVETRVAFDEEVGVYWFSLQFAYLPEKSAA